MRKALLAVATALTLCSCGTTPRYDKIHVAGYDYCMRIAECKGNNVYVVKTNYDIVNDTFATINVTHMSYFLVGTGEFCPICGAK